MQPTTTNDPTPEFRVRACRICGGTSLYEFLSLGSMPIPNGFLNAEELTQPEPHYPLGTVMCETCGLVQLTHVIPAERMFRNYLYIPSTSKTQLQHFDTLADESARCWAVQPGQLVVDIGSNDGSLLKCFKGYEARTLGIDPATNLAQVARMNGIDTINAFFSHALATRVRAEYGPARVITATNVLAHIDDLHDLCEGLRVLLADDGAFVSEFPYLAHMLEQNEFDTIYHEHLSYYSLRPLVRLFGAHGLKLVDVKPLAIHGGSVRISVVHADAPMEPAPVVARLLENERLLGLETRAPCDAFAQRVAMIRESLQVLLRNLRREGKRIVGYGAAAKGNVLLNSCGIGPDLLAFIADSVPYKQGRFTPGTHIPIFPEKKLEKDVPDYILLLAWNFADEIMQKMGNYRANGGQFIIHIPYVRIEGAGIPTPATVGRLLVHRPETS